jgi:hypothetical protein
VSSKVMELSDWDREVSSHLQFIEHGASMAARRAKQLPFKPGFETKAQGELANARKVLEQALADIIATQAIYSNKPLENERAA